MTDSAETASSELGGQPVAAASPPSWTPEPSAQESALGAVAERPEILVGAAFAGGLLLATILKRLAR